MESDIESIISNAEGLRHLTDDECFGLCEAVNRVVNALSDDERGELADALRGDRVVLCRQQQEARELSDG